MTWVPTPPEEPAKAVNPPAEVELRQEQGLMLEHPDTLALQQAEQAAAEAANRTVPCTVARALKTRPAPNLAVIRE